MPTALPPCAAHCPARPLLPSHLTHVAAAAAITTTAITTAAAAALPSPPRLEPAPLPSRCAHRMCLAACGCVHMLTVCCVLVCAGVVPAAAATD